MAEGPPGDRAELVGLAIPAAIEIDGNVARQLRDGKRACRAHARREFPGWRSRRQDAGGFTGRQDRALHDVPKASCIVSAGNEGNARKGVSRTMSLRRSGCMSTMQKTGVGCSTTTELRIRSGSAWRRLNLAFFAQGCLRAVRGFHALGFIERAFEMPPRLRQMLGLLRPFAG